MGKRMTGAQANLLLALVEVTERQSYHTGRTR